MRRIVPILIVLAALASTGCHTVTPQSQALRDEKQFLQDQRDDAQRLKSEDQRAAETPGGAAGAAHGALGSLHVLFVEFPRHLWDRWHGDTPAKYAREMEDQSSPDQRRIGLLKLSNYSFARDPKGPEVLRYRQIAFADTDPLVRAAAIRALNRSRSQKGTPIFIRALDDPEMIVRLEAAKALANIPDPLAVPKLQQHLENDDSKDVRIACADALRLYKTLDVAHSLITLLSERDFSVAWQAHRSLRLMTDKDFGYDEAAWFAYVSQPGSPFR